MCFTVMAKMNFILNDVDLTQQNLDILALGEAAKADLKLDTTESRYKYACKHFSGLAGMLAECCKCEFMEK